jgi:hypothetical protein
MTEQIKQRLGDALAGQGDRTCRLADEQRKDDIPTFDCHIRMNVLSKEICTYCH